MAATESARNLLLSLIFPVTADDMTETQAAEFELAVSEQHEYSSSYSGEIKSEALGDVRISYEIPSSKSSPLRYYGQPVSPSVIGRLSRCGLMRRWI